MSLENDKYSESIDHLLIKKFFYDNIPLVNDINTIEQEIKIGNRIADVYVELKNGKKVAIEIQHSRISKSELILRTKEYTQCEVHVLWILDGDGPYNRKPLNEDGVIITVAEKELHLMYSNRVYYTNATSAGITTPVYVLHFPPYIERNISSNGIIYYKQSKNKHSIVCGEIPSFKLTLLRRRGFKLARFFDQNLKNLCVAEVVQFLNNYTTYRENKFEEANKIFPDGLPLGVLINKFEVKYGLYLLFDTLRYLKFLKLQDGRYFSKKIYGFERAFFLERNINNSRVKNMRISILLFLVFTNLS